jgi:8-oxo-dGTP pyrophosphatase MutT (NUDIX family)
MTNWEKIESRVIYKGFITLYEDEVIDPNGNPGIRNRITVKKGSVVVIPRDKSGTFFLVGQDRYAVSEYSLEFPNGGVEEGEEVVKAAVRELGEETGLTSNKLHYVGGFHPLNSLMERMVHIVFADEVVVATDQSWTQDEYEKIDLEKCSLSKVRQMIEEDQIKDALTICAFMKFVLWSKTII